MTIRNLPPQPTTCPTCGAVRNARRPLTTRQAAVFACVRDYIAEHGHPPTYEEIAAHLGLRSLASVAEHLDTLTAKGYVRREFNRPQSLTLVDEPTPPAVTP